MVAVQTPTIYEWGVIGIGKMDNLPANVAGPFGMGVLVSMQWHKAREDRALDTLVRAESVNIRTCEAGNHKKLGELLRNWVQHGKWGLQ